MPTEMPTERDDRCRPAPARYAAARAGLLASVNGGGGLRLDPRPAAEGGCGVVGLAADVPVAGRHLVRALAQMRNRGNGKGGGVAMVGLDPDQLEIDAALLRDDHLVGVAYLDAAVRAEAERRFLEPAYEIDAVRELRPAVADPAVLGLEVRPPTVVLYLVRPRAAAVERLAAELAPGGQEGVGSRGTGAAGVARAAAAELVHQTSFRLNAELYAGPRGNLAYVQCHARNLLVLKMVGYAEDVLRYYGLEDMTAHVWIGHHRYPTKGRVWHPGGAHPFIGLNEALVHNGDFANYQSICDYLAQRRIQPLFMTDTEVAALVYDLHRRVYGYPLEYVIETLAPTTERDFTLLPPARREVYRALQTTHLHGSPDGPWFFIIAESLGADWRLIGVTDTSMLRPQVFACQRGEASIAFCASERQVIDAVLESLAAEDPRFWSRPDRTWAARGGSHTDGGAFVFTVRPAALGIGAAGAAGAADSTGSAIAAGGSGGPAGAAAAASRSGSRFELLVTDKFGAAVAPGTAGELPAPGAAGPGGGASGLDLEALWREPDGARRWARVAAALRRWSWDEAAGFLHELVEDAARHPARRAAVLALLDLLLDRRCDTGRLRRSRWLSQVDQALARLFAGIAAEPCAAFLLHGGPGARPAPDPPRTLVLDARRYAVEGGGSAAGELVALHRLGWWRFIVAHARGHRFLGCGLGPGTAGVRLDVYGSAGDYLGSGADGVEIHLHGDGQDQLAQIFNRGVLVVHGDVGQAFGYGAKGGEAYVLGSAAGRPLINAVGSPRVVINGTCLDYLAESFMAGDPLQGGGFVILNGIALDERGRLAELPDPYPGGNLFSLASGGALYIRDPHGRVEPEQLNGGELAPLTGADWDLILPYLETNSRHFDIPVARLLTAGGAQRSPDAVYRKVRPVRLRALQAEEAWVGHRG
jgi:glutamate synthase domain-containing protein 1/glutamate synthase domain-containing protein 3